MKKIFIIMSSWLFALVIVNYLSQKETKEKSLTVQVGNQIKNKKNYTIPSKSNIKHTVFITKTTVLKSKDFIPVTNVSDLFHLTSGDLYLKGIKLNTSYTDYLVYAPNSSSVIIDNSIVNQKLGKYMMIRAKDVIIKNSTIVGPPSYKGYFLKIKAKNVIIQGSVFSGTNGILIDSENKTVIQGNLFKGSTGVRIEGAANNSIENNFFQSDVAISHLDSSKITLKNNKYTKKITKSNKSNNLKKIDNFMGNNIPSCVFIYDNSNIFWKETSTIEGKKKFPGAMEPEC